MRNFLRALPTLISFILLVNSGLCISCTDNANSNIKQSFYNTINSAAQAALTEKKADLTKYEEALQKSSDYENIIKTLSPAIVDLSGYWIFDGTSIQQMHNNRFTIDNVIQMNAACKELSVAKAGVNWCRICSQMKIGLKEDIAALAKLIDIWKSGNTGWTVTPIQQGLYSIKGYGLGYALDAETGNWYFTAADNTIKSYDSAAQELSRLIQKQKSYDEIKLENKISYNCIPPEAKLRNTVDYWSIGQLTRDWRDGSPEVTSFLAQYPEVARFWNQIREIGYIVSYRGGLYTISNDIKKTNYYFQVIIP